tara:strand:+ start:646 stop:849 length:204 start_codon:yes stop_codon:yes gene_type:complete
MPAIELPAVMTPEELHNWRIKNKYGQEALAKALGITTNTVQNWEAGQSKIKRWLTLALIGLEQCQAD